MSKLPYVHADVFSRTAFNGNSLAVFPNSGQLSADQMLRITQELRHFESIFLELTDQPNRVRARVFDLFEELPFAGHPIIGAAAVLHALSGAAEPQVWRFDLPAKSVTISTEGGDGSYFGLLDQGEPAFLGEVDERAEVSEAFCLAPDDLHPDLPLEIVSTGLRYLVVPILAGRLAKARIARDITELLLKLGAQFAVLLEEATLEVRHWNNDGVAEDVATGSAAGVIGAYRLKHHLARPDETFILNQGRFAGRPSQLHVTARGEPRSVSSVLVGGDVVLVGSGNLNVLPGFIA